MSLEFNAKKETQSLMESRRSSTQVYQDLGGYLAMITSPTDMAGLQIIKEKFSSSLVSLLTLQNRCPWRATPIIILFPRHSRYAIRQIRTFERFVYVETKAHGQAFLLLDNTDHYWDAVFDEQAIDWKGRGLHYGPEMNGIKASVVFKIINPVGSTEWPSIQMAKSSHD